MGDTAEDMIEGRCCAICGVYFEDANNVDLCIEHGYPVLCEYCWSEASRAERKNYSKSLHPEMHMPDDWKPREE